MKNIFCFKSISIGILAFLMGPACFSAQPEVGKVISIKGQPFVLRTLKKISLKLDSIVHQGDIIRSGSNEHVTLLLKNGHKVFVLPSSATTLSMANSNKTEIDQTKGSLWFKVKPLEEKQTFHVRTPTAVAGVRGTAFLSMILENNITDICVCEGSVEVDSGKGGAILVPQGFGSASQKGKKASHSRSNTNFVHQKRRLSRKPVCVSCHWAGEGDTSHLDEESNLIFRHQ
jgi:hypothetical protein